MSLSAPSSNTDICNLTAIHLKQPLISNIDPVPDNGNAKFEGLCNAAFESVRRSALRKHPWNFAIKRIQLTEALDNTPPFGFAKAFQLPNDFIRYLSRHDDEGLRVSGTEDGDYQIENGFYLTDGNLSTGGTLNIRYIFDHKIVSRWDPLFIKFIALELAIDLAPNFSSSEQRLASLATLREDVKAEATAIDGQERPPVRTERSRWRSARRRGGRGAGKFTIFE